MEEIIEIIEVAHGVGNRKLDLIRTLDILSLYFIPGPYILNEMVRRSKNKKRSTGVTSEVEEDVFHQERLASNIS